MDLFPLLTPCQKSRLSCAKASCSGVDIDAKSIFVDISKVPERSGAGVLIPTVLTTSLIWSERLRRTLGVKEALVLQGVPCFPELVEDFGAEWTDAIGDTISDTQAMTLAGNGMFMLVSGTVLLWELACTSPSVASVASCSADSITHESAFHGFRFRSLAPTLQFSHNDDADTIE